MADVKVRQVLRDPEHAQFMIEQIDVLCEHYKKRAQAQGEDSPTEGELAQMRANNRRLRVIQKTIRVNMENTRKRAGEDIPDEF